MIGKDFQRITNGNNGIIVSSSFNNRFGPGNTASLNIQHGIFLLSDTNNNTVSKNNFHCNAASDMRDYAAPTFLSRTPPDSFRTANNFIYLPQVIKTLREFYFERIPAMKTLKALFFKSILTHFLLLTGFSCTFIDEKDVQDFLLWSENNRPDETGVIRVKGIQVLEQEGYFADPNLEIEVHMYEAETGKFIACSGAIQGLFNVDDTNRFYSVDAPFTKPDYGFLTIADITEKMIYLLVIENDDLEECPTPFQSGFDDVVGRSDSFCGCDLATTQSMSFENVPRLDIGI